MFTGRRLDTETGLYYYRARYYDSNLRRFIEPDPIGYSGGMNLYSYVVNNPVNWIDPFGLMRREYFRNPPKRARYVGPNGWMEFSKDLSASNKYSGAGGNATIAVGLGGTAGAGKAVSGSFMIATDAKGNVGFVESAGGGGVGVISGSGGILIQITDARDIYRLGGLSIQAGGSVGEGFNIGLERIYGKDYTGWIINIGWGNGLLPWELHSIVEYAQVQGRSEKEIIDFIKNLLSKRQMNCP